MQHVAEYLYALLSSLSIRLTFALWPIWSFLTLPLLVRIVYALLFYNIVIKLSSLMINFLQHAVYFVYGMHGYISPFDDWEVEATK